LSSQPARRTNGRQNRINRNGCIGSLPFTIRKVGR
jgi:hypothetical protein